MQCNDKTTGCDWGGAATLLTTQPRDGYTSPTIIGQTCRPCTDYTAATNTNCNGKHITHSFSILCVQVVLICIESLSELRPCGGLLPLSSSSSLQHMKVQHREAGGHSKCSTKMHKHTSDVLIGWCTFMQGQQLPTGNQTPLSLGHQHPAVETALLQHCWDCPRTYTSTAVATNNQKHRHLQTSDTLLLSAQSIRTRTTARARWPAVA